MKENILRTVDKVNGITFSMTLLRSGKEAKTTIHAIFHWLIVGRKAHSILKCHDRHTLTRSISLVRI